jgi:hypothetical protein
MKFPISLVVAAVSCGPLLGCAGEEATRFPDGLEPLGKNLAKWPAPKGGNAHPEDVVFVSGSTDTHDFANGRAFVAAPLAKTFEAMRDPEVCTNRAEVDRWSFKMDVEPEYDFSFLVHNVVEDIVTVEFDNTWRLSAIEGTVEDPKTVAVRWKKTWGSTYITLMEGSVVARDMGDGTTSLEMQEHLDASFTGPDTAVDTMREYYVSVVARAHGRPLP